jgi:hypothetical protein
MLWPENSIPDTFTVCSVTRYTGAARWNILNCNQSPSQGANWFHGHHSAWGGAQAYYSGFKTSHPVRVLDDWRVMCGTNAGATLPGNILLDRDEIGTADGGTGGCRLNIGYFQATDWALHALLIWNYSLGTVPARWHTSTTLSQLLLTWFLPWRDLGMR